MPDIRTHKSIGQRLDIDFPRNAESFVGRRRRWMIVCGVLPLLLAAAFAALGDQRIYWSRPVCTPHRLFENDCRQCHTGPAQTLVRMVTLDSSARSVDDAACRRCHRQSSHDHNSKINTLKVRDCVLCHHEHNGYERLNWVANSHCTVCHSGRLMTRDGTPAEFASDIGSFSQHPEFAVHRLAASGSTAIGPTHGVRQLMSQSDFDGERRWHDAAKIRFPHDKHLATTGVLLPHDHPENHDGRQRKTLTCNDCHQPESDGRYMRPVVYELHCRECHPLSFSTKLAIGGPLPHERSDLVIAVIRDRLMANADSQLAAPSASPLPRLPQKSPPGDARAKDKWEWVEALTNESGNSVFTSTKNGCALCHELESDAVSREHAFASLNRFQIVAPVIPERWMPHSRFRHDSHEMLDCKSCHTAHVSRTARDVLMPGIDVCRNCHGTESRANGNGQARSDCVECHVYHHSTDAQAGRPLADF